MRADLFQISGYWSACHMVAGRWPRGRRLQMRDAQPLRNNVGKADAVSQPFPHCPDSGAHCPSTVTITSQVTVNAQWGSASEKCVKRPQFSVLISKP